MSRTLRRAKATVDDEDVVLAALHGVAQARPDEHPYLVASSRLKAKKHVALAAVFGPYLYAR